MKHLHIITLGVTDLAKSKTFYESGFGWTATPDSNENIVFFNQHGFLVALYALNALQADVGVAPTDHTLTNGQLTLAHTTRSEAETDKIFEQLISLGAEALKQPQKVFWGGYSGYLSDPDGHLWEIAYNPFLTFDEVGKLS